MMFDKQSEVDLASHHGDNNIKKEETKRRNEDLKGVRK